MYGLTISVASALIAASLAIFQFILPNALALILTGLLSEEQPAVTWSVASRFFLSSDWPTFLRSESVSTSGVSGKISLVTWTKPIGFLLIAIAAVTTPLGLYDEISPVGRSQNVEFVYVPDGGLIGAGTPARSGRGYNFSRICDNYLCPGDNYLGNITRIERFNTSSNQTRPFSYYVVPVSISPTLIDLYQGNSADKSPSLSGYFDIEARQWSLQPVSRAINNASLLAPGYKYLSSVLMDNRIELVEGLILDMKTGGVGFRNHSVPDANSAYGAEWEEDILWMQPESACVDTNLTASYTDYASSTFYGTADLVDKGGFCDLQKISPYASGSNTTTDYVFGDGQTSPSLYERAYVLAWGHNAILMEYLNITDPNTNRSRVSSTFGQKYPKMNGSFTRVSSSSYLNDFFTFSRSSYTVSMPFKSSWNATNRNFTSTLNPMIKNPHNITSDKLISHANFCKGVGGGEKVNISRLDVTVGFLAGPAMMINRSDPNNASSLTTWERPLYACAAATRISIKTVRFRYNSTRFAKLSSLELLQIKDKIYKTETDKPTWGFEIPWLNATTPWNVSMIEPLWGLLKKPAPSNRNISVLHSDHFFIPASYGSLYTVGWASLYSYQSYTPGTTGPPAAWYGVFGRDSYSGDEPYTTNDQQIQRFYRDMMKNATSTSRMLNLMWTDQAANLLVGTKGLHTTRHVSTRSQTLNKRDVETSFSSLPQGQYPVHFLDRRIRYKWVYGIPALICVGLIGIVLAFAFVSFVCGLGTIARLRWFMFNSTSGRVLASQKYPDVGRDKSTTTGKWLKAVGYKNIVVSGYEAEYEMYRVQSTEKRPPAYERVAQREEYE